VIVVWIVIAAVLIAVEMHHLAFFAMFGAIGAGAAALVCLVAPSAVAIQIAVAIVVATVGLLVARPYVSRAFAHRGPNVRIGGVHGGLISAVGVTTDVVGADTIGHVRILGENWLAIPEPYRGTIPPTTKVIVTAVTGTTLTVKPVQPTEESP
jgi:membrane protein implicated in regulation of membrane protease activity